MENRERDKGSRNTGSNPAGDVNRKTSSEIGSRRDESGREFGRNIGRGENLEEEPGRRAPAGEEGMSGSEGRRGPAGSTGGGPLSDMESNRHRESEGEEEEGSSRH
ncbi:MAG TPA: hypothetical protein VNL91_05335 [Thermoanaerobaculia bacterium]|nr:hypothetical protein [Thermoanaerobaculia bacterium]